MNPNREQLVSAALNARVCSLHSLSGGSISDVCRVELGGGLFRIAKFANSDLLKEEEFPTTEERLKLPDVE